MLKRYIGDRAFYKHLFVVAIPIIVQNAITNFVSLLDNIMIGQVGTAQMSGVSIVNQLIFVFNLFIFGAVSGAGIFTSQFFGAKDEKGMRYTMRFKLIFGILISLVGIFIFEYFGQTLIGLYLKGEGEAQQARLSLEYGLDYLRIMLIGLIPFGIANAYSSTLRETYHGMVPMFAGTAAVVVNLVFNYILIFGKFGAPALGVNGAAIATVISRYVELAIVVIWSHAHSKENTFFRGIYRSPYIPGKLFSQIIVKGMPLLVNEGLWSIGIAMINQCYSTVGYNVVAGQNISSTLLNFSSVVYLSMGNVVGIIMGRMLGEGRGEAEVRDSNRKLTAFAIGCCFIFGSLTIALSGVFPMIYNTTPEIRSLATAFICISACMMPFHSYVHSVYFTLRSGGQTLVTFLFDSCFIWCCTLPCAFVLTRFTNMHIIPLFAICQGTELLKCVLGAIMIKQGKWLKSLVSTNE